MNKMWRHIKWDTEFSKWFFSEKEMLEDLKEDYDNNLLGFDGYYDEGLTVVIQSKTSDIIKNEYCFIYHDSDFDGGGFEKCSMDYLRKFKGGK